MRRPILFASAIASTLLASGAFAAGPLGTIHVGFWQGGAYTNYTTGAFSHCAAISNFGSGINVIISQHANRVWIIGFGSLNWNLPEGQSNPIDLTFDGQSQFRVFGTTQQKLITAVLPTPALNALRKSRLMVATGGNKPPVNFELAMVDKLVHALSNLRTNK